MAFTDTPSVIFGTNYAFSTPLISISNADNPAVTDAEAHVATGDSRKILYGLLQNIYTRYMAIATADKPAKMTLARTTNVNDAAQSATVTFTIRFTTDDVTTEVAAEA